MMDSYSLTTTGHLDLTNLKWLTDLIERDDAGSFRGQSSAQHAVFFTL